MQAASAQLPEGISASVRNIAFQTDASDGDSIVANLTRARLEWRAERAQLSAHLAYDQEFLFGALLKDPAFIATAGRDEPTYFDASQLLRNDETLWWRQRLYRASLRLQF